MNSKEDEVLFEKTKNFLSKEEYHRFLDKFKKK